MYLARKIDNVLNTWKNTENHLPIVIKGPRQIGKTESIRRFAEKNYESLVEINFVEEPRYRTICADGYRAQDIIKNISLIDPTKRFLPGKTLIFFDEIQSFPNIATTLKFFKEDGRFDVICSGSLLGISYKEIESVSVGSKMDVMMHSMDFEEFLWAKGYDQSIIDSIYEHVEKQIPFSEMEMDVFHRLFLDFCILGGMPAVVRSYIQTNTFEGTLAIQQQLLQDYEEDIQKYLEGLDRTRVLNIFRQIPVQLARENKKFQVSKVAHGARSKDYWGCVEWLENAGIINRCSCMNTPELPIRGNVNPEKFKLYFHDTGLLVASLDQEAQEDLRFNKNLGIYKGALYENFVGTALVAQGYDLCYYKKENSTLEEDFFVRTTDSLVPVEVKAGNTKSKSLNMLVNGKGYEDIRFGLKLCAGNIGYKNNIYTLPYFCAFVLRKWLKTL
ncbi:MAG: ATP-binding protein [Burkholderiaceae bacterium]|nr:ATP-binding protein [Burkholderiaceae bacterium]